MPKLPFLFVLRSVNSFAVSMVESLSVLSLCMFKTVRLLNRFWFILERSHVFSLRAGERDLSPAALVAGFTRISLQNVISNGNRTEWSPIQSVIIRVITKSDDRAAGVRFVYHEYDYRLKLDDAKSYYQLIIKITISEKK